MADRNTFARMLAGMDNPAPTSADIPTGDTRDSGVGPPADRRYDRHPAREKQFIAQRFMRGLGDLGLGAADLVNMVGNAGIRDVDYATGGGLSGGKFDPYQFSMPSQNAADVASSEAAKRGVETIDPETMTPGVQAKGDAARNLIGSLPVGPEALAPASKAMFLGLASKLADRPAQKLAKRMLAEGASREEVLKATGWFKQHGDWKYEIDDTPAKLGTRTLRELTDQGSTTGNMAGTLWHDEAYAGHPDLRSIEATTGMGGPYKASGSFRPGEINATAADESDLRSVLLHEMQHGVQHTENFPRGGSPKDPSLVRSMSQLKEDAGGKFGTLNLELLDFQKARAGSDFTKYPALAREWRAANPDKARIMDKALDVHVGPGGPSTGYHHLAGEVEARNVERRRSMSMDERRATAPWDTQDVPDELQLVRRHQGRNQLAEMAPGTEGVASPLPLGDTRISQRFPKPGPDRAENPLTDNLLANMNLLRNDPKKAQQAADIVSTYPMTTDAMKEMHPNERLDAFRDQLKGNYTALWDMMGKQGQDRASQWYLGANRIAGERAAEVGVSPQAAAGTYAALSPQKDWFMNVHLGDSVLRTLAKDPKVTPDMLRVAQTIKPFQEGAMPDVVRGLEGRRLSKMSPEEQAIAVRLYDEAHGPGQYSKISPEGDYGDPVTNKSGKLGKPAWNTQDSIEKAVQAAQSGGDTNILSPLMGNKHKVRNFYNNIAAPNEGEAFGDITADTHQIAAGHFRPLTGNSPEVLQGLNSGSGGVMTAPRSAETGLQGLYPIYADATRMAAHERGVPTRAMQSTPWEAIRALYPLTFKKPDAMQSIDDIWSAVGRGEITPEDARKLSIERAGGFRPPKW